MSGAIRSWKRQGRILPQSLWREHDPADTMILYFQPQGLWENCFHFSATELVVIYYGSLRKLMSCYSLKSVRNTMGNLPTAGANPVLVGTVKIWIPRMLCSSTSLSKGICFLWFLLISHIAYLFFLSVFNDMTQGRETNTRFGLSFWFCYRASHFI